MPRTRTGQGAARPGLTISAVPDAPSTARGASAASAPIAAEAVDPRLCRLESYEWTDAEGRPVRATRYVPLTRAELDRREADRAADEAARAAEDQEAAQTSALRSPVRAVFAKLRQARQAGTLGTAAALSQPELELAMFALLRQARGAM